MPRKQAGLLRTKLICKMMLSHEFYVKKAFIKGCILRGYWDLIVAEVWPSSS